MKFSLLMFLFSFEKNRKKRMNKIFKKIKNKKKEKKKIKGLVTHFPFISWNISIGVRVFVLIDITLVKC